MGHGTGRGSGKVYEVDGKVYEVDFSENLNTKENKTFSVLSFPIQNPAKYFNMKKSHILSKMKKSIFFEIQILLKIEAGNELRYCLRMKRSLS